MFLFMLSSYTDKWYTREQRKYIDLFKREGTEKRQKKINERKNFFGRFSFIHT